MTLLQLPRLGSRASSTFADLLDGRLRPQDVPVQLQSLLALTGALAALPSHHAPTSLSNAAASAAIVSRAATSHPAAAHPASAAHATIAHATGATKISGLMAGLPAWAPLATGAALIGTVTAGLGSAAHLSGPGAAFYGLKQQIERVQVALTATGADAARERLSQAQTRINELKTLISELPAKPSADQLATVHRVIQDWVDLVTLATPALTHTLSDARQLSAFLTQEAIEVSTLVSALRPTDADLMFSVLRTGSTAVATVPGIIPPVIRPPVVTPTAPVPVLSSNPTPSRPAGSGTPSPSVSPSAGPTPTPVPTIIPTSPPTSLPTTLPTTLPTSLPTLPVPTPSLPLPLPSLPLVP